MAVSAGYILENDKMTWVMNKEGEGVLGLNEKT